MASACLMAAASNFWMVCAQPKQSSNFTGGTVTPIDDKEDSIGHFRLRPRSPDAAAQP
jgi:hypothetical protein